MTDATSSSTCEGTLPPARIGLVGAQFDKTVFGTPAEPCILSFLNVREVAVLMRPLSKQVAGATRGCIFKSMQHWFDEDATSKTLHVRARQLGLFRHSFPKAETAQVYAADMVDQEAVHLRGIRCVSIECFSPQPLPGRVLTDAGLALLAGPKLEELYLMNARAVRGTAFSKMAGLKTLWLTGARHLDPAHCRFPPSLVDLGMKGCGAGPLASGDLGEPAPIARSVLGGLPNLKRFTITGTPFARSGGGDEADGPAVSFPRLEELDLTHSGTPTVTACPVPWSQAPLLRSLALNAEESVVLFPEPLTSLPLTVRVVSTMAVEVRDEDVARLPALETLTVSASTVLTGSFLTNVPALRSMAIRGCQAFQHFKLAAGSDLHTVELVGLPLLTDDRFGSTGSVTSLFLERCRQLTDGCLDHFPALQYLTAKYCQKLPGPGVVAYAESHAALTYVRLSRLQRQATPYDGVTDEGKAALDACAAGLEALGFSHCERNEGDEDRDGGRIKVKMVREAVGAEGEGA